jgi:putative flippase GtrA
MSFFFSPRFFKLIRYLISGGTAAAVTLSVSFICTSLLKIHYLTSSVIAFSLGLCVSFVLQKFWTFTHHSLHRVKEEAGMYLLVGLFNLCINALLMFFFVEKMHLWYLLGQFLAAGLIAIESYYIYKIVVFKQHLNQ